MDNDVRQELHDTKAQLALAIRAANIGLWDWDLRTNKSYLSPAWKRQLGYEDHEISNRHEEWEDRLHPDDCERVLYETGESLQNDSSRYETEFRLRHKDGSYRWIRSSGMVLRHEDGTPYRKVGCHIDITENVTGRKQAEESLLRGEGIHRSLTNDVLETSNVGLFVLDAEFRVVRINRALERYFDLQREHVVGKDKRTLIRERINDIFEDSETFIQKVFATYDDNTYVENFECHILPQGLREERWLEHWSQPIRTGFYAGGRVEHYYDITARKQSEERRRQLENKIQHTQKLESLGVLAGGIAHDFNNLLMGVLGNSDLALNELPSTSPAAQYIEQVQTAATRAADLCKQMLAYSGKGRFVVKAFSVNELVEEMLRLLDVSISKSAILKYNFAENIPPVEGDVNQIRQVVMNLVTNASDAIGSKSGVITISTGLMEADQDYLSKSYLHDNLPEGLYSYIEVSDTGCGMDDETLAKMFDPFFTTKFTGRGLGLAAVLGIVRGHHGALKVYSQTGRGTTMKVLLPGTDQPADTLLEEAPITGWQGSGTILVVDDEETARTVAKKMLEQSGFNVLTAIDGREAIEVFRSHVGEIRAVLLDMTMPHLNGEETFRELRQIQGDVKVAMMSGYNEQDVTSRFAGKGLAGFIQKPFRQRDLLRKMREVLGESEAVRHDTILIIDDHEIVLESAKALLESFGYVVLTASNGRSGIDSLKEHVDDVAVVLLDLNLPDIRADAIFQELRQHSNVPVVLLTGYLTEDVAAEYREMGFAATLQKPLPMETLPNLLREVLQTPP